MNPPNVSFPCCLSAAEVLLEEVILRAVSKHPPLPVWVCQGQLQPINMLSVAAMVDRLQNFVDFTLVGVRSRVLAPLRAITSMSSTPRADYGEACERGQLVPHLTRCTSCGTDRCAPSRWYRLWNSVRQYAGRGIQGRRGREWTGRRGCQTEGAKRTMPAQERRGTGSRRAQRRIWSDEASLRA